MKDINDRFGLINLKFVRWEMKLSLGMMNIESKHDSFKMSVGSAIVGSSLYKWGSMHDFMCDYMGEDYCKDYTKEDWIRQYEIESIKNRK